MTSPRHPSPLQQDYYHTQQQSNLKNSATRPRRRRKQVVRENDVAGRRERGNDRSSVSYHHTSRLILRGQQPESGISTKKKKKTKDGDGDESSSNSQLREHAIESSTGTARNGVHDPRVPRRPGHIVSGRQSDCLSNNSSSSTISVCREIFPLGCSGARSPLFQGGTAGGGR